MFQFILQKRPHNLIMIHETYSNLYANIYRKIIFINKTLLARRIINASFDLYHFIVLI